MIKAAPATIEGFLTHDPEFKVTRTGKSLLLFNLAIRHYRKPETIPIVTFVHIEAWDLLAGHNKDKLKKGTRVRVIGYLRQDRWESDNDEICSRIKIVADEIDILKEC